MNVGDLFDAIKPSFSSSFHEIALLLLSPGSTPGGEHQ